MPPISVEYGAGCPNEERHLRAEEQAALPDVEFDRDVLPEAKGVLLRAAKTSTARRSKSAAPPKRDRSSRENEDRPRRARPGRVVPVPATLAWMLEAQIQLNGEDCDLLFTTSTGRLWRERTFYRDLWKPAQEASGLDIRPHECRHSYVTRLRAAGVNDADLAEIAGHRIETMLARYAHPTRGSFQAVREALG